MGAAFGCGDAQSDGLAQDGPFKPGASARAPPDLEQYYELLRVSEYDSLDTLLPPLLAGARNDGDSARSGRVLTLQAYVALRRGVLGEARALGEEALARLTSPEQEPDAEVYRTYNLLGLVAYQQSRLADALRLYQSTLETAPEGQGDRTLVVVSINRGLVLMDLGRFSEAQVEFERGRDLARLIENARLEAIALSNLGMAHIWAGDPQGSLTWVSQGLELSREVGFTDAEVNALGQMGTAYTALGDMGRARAVLDTAIERARAEGLGGEEASSLEALAELHRVSGDLRTALARYEDAERLYASLGYVAELGSDLRNRAEILATLGDTALARDLAARALATHTEVDARWEALGDLILLADLEHARESPESRSGRLAEARSLVETIDAPSARIELALAEARIALRWDEAGRMLEVLDGVSGDVAVSGYHVQSEWETLRAQALERLGRYSDAERAGRLAVDAADMVRSSLGDARTRLTYVGSRRLAYWTLVQALLRRGATDEAFRVADAARAVSLLAGHSVDAMEGRDGSVSPPAVEQAELITREMGAMSQAVDDLNAGAAGERDEVTLAELRNSLERSRGELVEAREGAYRDDPARTVLGLGRTLDTKEVQQSLMPGEALLEYLLGPEQTTVFVLTRDTMAAFGVSAGEADLARRVRIARDLAGRADWDPRVGGRALAALHRILLGPVVELIRGTDRIVFVPDGVLNYLPFAALLDPDTDRFLVEDHRVQLAPSGASLAVLRSAARAEVGAPMRGLVLAPLDQVLPATEDEARSIATAVQGMRPLLGDRATEARLRESLGRPEIVHVATHGELNPRNPLFSRIVLAGGRSGDPLNDGQLEVHEVLEMEILSPLVVLSGCETGLGASFSTGFARGDDYSALGQAFLYGGADNVVATLWRVDDHASSELAVTFYSELGDGDPVEALAAAQRQLLATPGLRAPFYWAGYQLSGAGRMR
jgi:CHAT domain-containing protein/Tfp pilus assembly protein PilF